MFKSFPNPPKDWLDACLLFLTPGCLETLDHKLQDEREKIFPAKDHIFKALEMSSFESTKVVIMGQDPYHGEGEATGLCFAVPDGTAWPPSLKNLAKELKSDLGKNLESSNLESWAKQGVLLLNRTLTVQKDKPLSHKHLGWDDFTLAIVRALIARSKPCVFVAFGKEASNYLKPLLKNAHSNIVLLEFPHPSPLSAYRGFFNSKPFTQINSALASRQESPLKFGN